MLATIACRPGPASFEFRPEEGATYRIRESHEVGATTPRGRVELERSESVARVEVTRPDSWRWGFVYTFEEMERVESGVRLSGEDPVLAAFIGTPLTVEVWEDGIVGSVTGPEAIERRLMASMGRAGEPPVLGLAFARLMEESVREAWAERVATLVGRQATVGDRWEVSLETRLPSGGALTVARESRFESWEECGSARCARLAYSDRGGGTEWSGALERAINELARSLCPDARRVEVLEVSFSGEGERLVEPSTLFTHRDAVERRFELRVRLDDGEEDEVSRVEKETFEAERLNGEEI